MTLSTTSWTTPDGGTMVCVPLPGARTVAVQFWVTAGAVDEPSGGSGAAHLLEHLLVREANRALGTARLAGASFTGATTADATSLRVEAAPDRLTDLLRAGAAALSGPLDGDVLAVERTVLARELFAHRSSGLEARARAKLAATFGAGHPYARSVAGEPEEVARLTLEALEHVRGAHHPRRTTVVVAGAVEEEAARRAIEGADLRPGGERPTPHEFPPADHGIRRVPLGAGRSAWVGAGPALGHPDRPLVELAARAASFGRSDGWTEIWAGRAGGMVGRVGHSLPTTDPDSEQIKGAREALESWNRHVPVSPVAAAEVVGLHATCGAGPDGWSRGVAAARDASREALLDALERWTTGEPTGAPAPRAGPAARAVTIRFDWTVHRWGRGPELLTIMLDDPQGPLSAELRGRRGLVYAVRCRGVHDGGRSTLRLATRTSPAEAAGVAEALSTALSALVAPSDLQVARVLGIERVQRLRTGIAPASDSEGAAALRDAAARILGRPPDHGAPEETAR